MGSPDQTEVTYAGVDEVVVMAHDPAMPITDPVYGNGPDIYFRQLFLHHSALSLILHTVPITRHADMTSRLIKCTSPVLIGC